MNKVIRHIPTAAGILLGLAFIAASTMYLFDLAEAPPLEEGSPPQLFMSAVAPTGYLTFIKILELAGGVLVAIPLTRRLGLLILCPIVVNIVAYHTFLMDGEGLAEPMIVAVLVLTAFLLVVERKALVGLIKRPKPAKPAPAQPTPQKPAE